MTLSTLKHPNSTTTFPFNAVSYATFYWRNKEDSIHVEKEPKYLSTHGVIFNADAIALYVPGYEGETMLERAKRLDILDTWTPVFKMTMKNGHPLTFEGERAKKLHEAWNGYVFSRAKQGRNSKKKSGNLC